MYKKMSWLTILLAASLFTPLSATAATPISIEINGAPLQMEEQPFIQYDRTLVPLRAIFEALDAEVVWDDASRTVTATRGDVTIRLTLDEWVGLRNGAAINLDAEPVIRDGRMYVPVRFIAESFNTPVEWDDATSTVRLLPSNVERLQELLDMPEQEVQSFHMSQEVTLGKIDPSVTEIDYADLGNGEFEYHTATDYTFPYTNIREQQEVYVTGNYVYLYTSMSPQKTWKKIAYANLKQPPQKLIDPSLPFPANSSRYAVLEEQPSEDIITFYTPVDVYAKYLPEDNIQPFLEPGETASVENVYHLDKATHQVTRIVKTIHGRYSYESGYRPIVTYDQRYSKINEPYKVELSEAAQQAIEVKTEEDLF